MKITKNITPKESEIQKSILEYLHLKKIFVWQNKTQGTFDPVNKFFRKNYSINGVSDLIGIYKNRFLAIEVKRKGGVVSDDQKYFIKKINEEGGLAFVAYSIDDVIANLKSVDN